MAEVIDLAAYRNRQRLLDFLTKGVPLDIDEQMLEEFQFHLEYFLGEIFKEYSFINDGHKTLEVTHLNQTIMFFHFLNEEFSVSLPYGADIGEEAFLRQVGTVANSALQYWLAFEREIPIIQQSFL